MSALTKDIRRATLDMDLDFVHHPITDTGVKRFVARLAKSIPEVTLSIQGRVKDVRHHFFRTALLASAAQRQGELASDRP